MYRHRHRALITAFAASTVLVITAALTACSGTVADGNVAPASERSVYRLPIGDPASEIDPLTEADQYALAITGLVTEPLVSLDAKGELDARLATRWVPSDDGMTWTVELRPGAEFNDGSPVTAADVAATFAAITDEDSLSPGRSAFVGILDSITTADDHTVEFHLLRPFSDFPLLLTGTNTGILPADYEQGTWLDNPLGAGQFLLEEYVIGKGATYVKNPNYWNAEAIELDGVELKIYGDMQAQLLAFQAGEIDRIGLTSEVAATVDVSEYDVVSSGYNRFDGLFFDVTSPPFDDTTIRQAVAWAIDRPALIEAVYEGNADVANDTVFFPDYRPQPSGLEQRERNLDRVEQLLAGRTVAFTITTAYQLFGEVLQQQLNAVPGFDVQLEVMSSEEFYADSDSTPWLHAPVTATNWAKRGPSQYLSLVFATGAPWNASHYSNPILERAAAQFDETTDATERQQLADEIAAIQWTDVPVVIPAYSKSQALQSRRVAGEFVGALDFYAGYNFAGISIED
jgi:peptide/nickel transport system substrate-binding protein